MYTFTVRVDNFTVNRLAVICKILQGLNLLLGHRRAMAVGVDFF